MVSPGGFSDASTILVLKMLIWIIEKAEVKNQMIKFLEFQQSNKELHILHGQWLCFRKYSIRSENFMRK